jgi:hypothetical protein
MELCTSTWLKHDYEDEGVVDIFAVNSYSGVELCTPIFLGEASKFFLGSKSFLEFCKTQMDTSLNKAPHNNSCYMDNICLW